MFFFVCVCENWLIYSEEEKQTKKDPERVAATAWLIYKATVSYNLSSLLTLCDFNRQLLSPCTLSRW